MIITEPNAFVAKVHDRMPALLAEKDFNAWLGGSAGRRNPQACSLDVRYAPIAAKFCAAAKRRDGPIVLQKSLKPER